ncbi:hypothetical protein MTR_4g039790 [Medicago truncatula]|uniref:Uncharacterized protein n=1 Tax=Medicago truncatula TaxID=3880 RepID=G7JUL9_MEDTR|nr:hypothetical protein MTR_4g039790 [Medicago truncatula]
MQLISPISSFVGENMQNSISVISEVSSENFPDSNCRQETKAFLWRVKKENKTKAPLIAAPGDHNALVLIILAFRHSQFKDLV